MTRFFWAALFPLFFISETKVLSENLKFYGNGVYKGVNITRKLSLNGNISVSDSVLRKFSLHGMGVFNQTAFYKGTVFGNLKMTSCKGDKLRVYGTFDGDKVNLDRLRITSDCIRLNDCKINHVKVKNNTDKPAKVYLTGKNTIPEIEFVDGEGIVYVPIGYKMSKITLKNGRFKVLES